MTASKEKKVNQTLVVIAYSTGIAALFPVILLVYQWLEKQPFFASANWIFVVLVVALLSFLIAKLFLFWDKGTHLIQSDEQKKLLELIDYVHGDLSEFFAYFDDFLTHYYGEDASHSVYLSVFENDANVGLGKIEFGIHEDGFKFYNLPTYQEFLLPKNDLTANLLNLKRRPALVSDLESLRMLGVSLPGTLVFPLLSSDGTVLGLWSLDVGDEYEPTDSPMMVISFAHLILEGLLFNIYLQKNNSKSNEHSQSAVEVMNFNQAVNIVNIILHEIATPMAIVRNNVSLMKRGIQLDAQMVHQMETTIDRITKRIGKMARYANLINSEVKMASDCMTVGDVIHWLQNEYKKNKLNEVAVRQGKNISINVMPEHAIKKNVLCTPIALSGLYEILENAIIYSPKQHDIQVKIQYTKDSQRSGFIFSFTNYGTLNNKVLENYKYVATSTNFMEHSSAEKGIGIGLPLAFMSVSKMGGNLELRNIDNNRYVLAQIFLPEK